MKKLFKPLIGLLVLFLISSCSVDKVISTVKTEHDDFYYYDGDTISVYDKDALSGSVTIPTSYNGTAITKIKAHGFEDCDKITSLKVPNSIEIIGEAAFSGCKSLTKVELPFVGENKEANYSKQSLFGYIFGNDKKDGCIETRTYYYPNNGSVATGYTSYIPSGLEVVNLTSGDAIRQGAFRNVTTIKTIAVSASIKDIGKDAFYGCSSLESFTSLEGRMYLKSIDDEAFRECASLKAFNSYNDGEFVLPDTLERVGEYAFEGCVKMESISSPFIGEKRDATDDEGFFGYIFGKRYHKETTEVEFTYDDDMLGMNHDVVLYIPSLLRNVTITNADRVPDHAFRNMSMLTSLRINSGAQNNVGHRAFDNCIEPIWF